jgi:hypothetical protein
MTQAHFNWFVFICIFAFPLLSYLIHRHQQRQTDLSGFKLMQLGFAGATFPTFAILLVGLVYPRAREVLSGQDVFLALAGFAGVILTLATVFPERPRGG